MFRIILNHLGFPAIAALAVLIPADPAFARGGGGGGHGGGGGFHGGGGGYRGGYGGYRGGYGGYHSYDRGFYRHDGYGYLPYYWGDYYPYNSDYGLGDYTAPYAGGNGYYTPGSDSSSQSNYLSSTSNGSAVPATSPTAQSSSDNVAHITVKLPDQAELWLNNTMMLETGAVRQFTTPPLTSGQRYSYMVRARWLNGETFMAQQQKITFAAGENVEAIFPLGSQAATQASLPEKPLPTGSK